MPIHDWSRVYAGLFHDFHQTWTIYIKDALNQGLLPTGMNALIDFQPRPTEPDVPTIVQIDPPATSIVRKSSKEFYSDLANRIVVKHRLGRTVAVIEIVSPGNKDSKRAFKEFLEKSLEFITAGIHLLVVDLFPPTKRNAHGVHRAIWDEFEDEDKPFEFPAGKDRILASYKAGREKVAYAEPLAVGDAMPDMPLFLVGDYHIQVPLEATYQTTWSVFPQEMQTIVETGVMPEVEAE